MLKSDNMGNYSGFILVLHMPNPNISVSLKKQPIQERSIATVEAVLEACALILEEQGLMAINTNDIAKRAGIGVASLYQYFSSKETILAELIRRDRAKFTRELEFASRPVPGDTLGRVSLRMVKVSVAFQLDRPGLSRALEYIQHMLPLEQEREQKYSKIAGIVTEGLRYYGVQNPETAAWDISAMTRGMIDEAATRGETDQDELSERVYKAVLGYLGK